MSIRFIISLFILAVLTVYFTFLNNQSIEVYFTQNHPIKLPIVVFMLGSILLGVILTSLFTSWGRLKSFFKSARQYRYFKKREKQNKVWEKMSQKAENAFATGHEQKGVALFEKILAQNPQHIGSINHIGNHYRTRGQYDKAIEMHKRASELDPENVHALDNLAEDYAATNKSEKQINALARILDLDPNSLPTLRKLREVYLQVGNLEKAYQAQKSILPLIHDSGELSEEQEKFSQIVYTRGLAHYKNKSMDPAITEFKRSIRENSQSLPAYITLGDIYFEMSNPKAALKTWKTGYEYTQSPVCLSRIKKVYEQLNKPKEIEKSYREAIKNNENSHAETLVLHFANYLLDQNDIEQALEVLESVKEPSLAVRLLTIKALRKNNSFKESEKITESAYEKVSESITGYTCSSCSNSLDEWSGLCPECNSWNTIKPN